MTDSDQAPSLSCPSARCEPGAVLLGVVRTDGTVAYLGGGEPIDEAFVATARAGRTPEKRFRFAGRCVEGACAQWTGHSCGVIEKALAAPEVQAARDPDAALPRCAIRPSCRWYRQEGRAACEVCPRVITDSSARAAADE